MATRATYKIGATVFYCHWDGYPTGAAQRFANMVQAMTVPDAEGIEGRATRRGGWQFAFIRGVMDAEPTEGHDSHGDTEYRYTLDVDNTGKATIVVEEVTDMMAGEWKCAYVGELSAWLNQQRAELVKQIERMNARGYNGGNPIEVATEAIPPIVRVEIDLDGWHRCHYATATDALKIARILADKAGRFGKDNVNRLHTARQALAWMRGIGVSDASIGASDAPAIFHEALAAEKAALARAH